MSNDHLDFQSNPLNLSAKYLIQKHLKETPKGKDYGREIGIAYRILKKAPEVIDMEIGFKLNSLAWFMTRSGIEAINRYNFRNNKQFTSSEIKSHSKPKETTIIKMESGQKQTLLDFLN